MPGFAHGHIYSEHNNKRRGCNLSVSDLCSVGPEKHSGEPHKIYLDIENAGLHVVSFSMREDGFEFDKWLMTKDREMERPEDSGPTECIH